MSEGQYVTPREFDEVNRRIASLETTLRIVGEDVKSLLAAHNREEGATEERKSLIDAQHDKGARRIAWSGLLAAGLGGLWWVQDAIAKLSH